MNSEDLKKRTKLMSLSVLALASSVRSSRESDVIVRQLIRSATSVAANYRAACKARSRADFINKIGIVEEEADETALWLEYLIDLHLAEPAATENALREVRELVAIFAASAKTAKRNKS
ncbi:MAG: four helix bundle protein [Ignavibacteriales bacterium]|nr:four helix bundle protein [Ignavibacteriales bacterium]